MEMFEWNRRERILGRSETDMASSAPSSESFKVGGTWHTEHSRITVGIASVLASTWVRKGTMEIGIVGKQWTRLKVDVMQPLMNKKKESQVRNVGAHWHCRRTAEIETSARTAMVRLGRKHDNHDKRAGWNANEDRFDNRLPPQTRL